MLPESDFKKRISVPITGTGIRFFQIASVELPPTSHFSQVTSAGLLQHNLLEVLLSFLEHHAIPGKLGLGEGCLDVFALGAVHGHAALLHVSSCVGAVATILP